MTALALAGDVRSVASFARKAWSQDSESVIRVIARGDRVAFFVRTAFETLAMRAIALTEPATFDVVVESATLAARTRSEQGNVLRLPPEVPALTWTSGLPPMSGWTEIGRLPADAVAADVDQGVAEFRRRIDEVAEEDRTQALLESLAQQIWDRPLIADVPLRLAHTARSYGFLADPPRGGAEVRVLGAGPWRRLDAVYGAVLGRERTTATLLGL